MSDDGNTMATLAESAEAAPCHCPAYDPACERAGAPMSLRQWELCSNRCPHERPCPHDAENYRRRWDGLPVRSFGPPPAPRPACARRGDRLPLRVVGAAEEAGCCGDLTEEEGYACEVHGRCTIGRRIKGVAHCSRCADYVSTLDQPKAGEVRNLLYHIYPIAGNGVWQWNVGQLLRRINLFNGHRVVAIATDGRTDTAQDVKDLFAGRIHEFIEVPNNPSLREVHTFEALFERAENLAPNQVTLYAHAKGVRHPAHAQHIRRWVELLYETYLDYWPFTETVLRQHPTAGSLKVHGRPDCWRGQTQGGHWYYSSSWFWFRNKDLFNRNWRRVDRFWTGIEPYPSLHFTAAEGGVLFHEEYQGGLDLHNTDPARNVFSLSPSLEAWRREHAGQRKEW